MEPHFTTSPRWSSTTKLLMGLVLVGIVAFLFVRFTNLITPLLLVFILAYLLHPLTIMISRGLRIPWKVAVNILYFIILVLLIGLLTLGGFGLVAQIQNLIGQVQTIIADLPGYIQALSGQVFRIGPFTLDMRTLDLNEVSRQLLSFIEPLLGRTGTLVGTVASGAVEIFGWTFFVLLVSYFVMIESSGLQSDLLKVEIPGYSEDLRRLSRELGRIWNAFLRGQIFIVGFSSLIYIFILSFLGVRYAIGIAIMAGLAKFLPYIGPGITWIVLALVTYFQPYKAANLLGILGVVIAAPLLATLMLLGRYVMRKMFDINPWPPGEITPTAPLSFEWITRTRVFILSKFQKNIPNEPKYPRESSDE